MLNEISQYDIPDRQLLATNRRPGTSRTDIGDAKITHTVFGRAKIRVIRKRDNNRRAWLLAALAVTVLSAATWQGWIASQQAESLKNDPPPLPLSARIRISAPEFQAGNLPAPDNTPLVKSKPLTPSQTQINTAIPGAKSAPQQPPGSRAVGPIAAKPATGQSLAASKPPAASLATTSASKDQAVMQQPIVLPPPDQPVAPAVATPPDAQPAATMPTAVVPLVAPLVN